MTQTLYFRVHWNVSPYKKWSFTCCCHMENSDQCPWGRPHSWHHDQMLLPRTQNLASMEIEPILLITLLASDKWIYLEKVAEQRHTYDDVLQGTNRVVIADDGGQGCQKVWGSLWRQPVMTTLRMGEC